MQRRDFLTTSLAAGASTTMLTNLASGTEEAAAAETEEATASALTPTWLRITDSANANNVARRKRAVTILRRMDPRVYRRLDNARLVQFLQKEFATNVKKFELWGYFPDQNDTAADAMAIVIGVRWKDYVNDREDAVLKMVGLSPTHFVLGTPRLRRRLNLAAEAIVDKLELLVDAENDQRIQTLIRDRMPWKPLQMLAERAAHHAAANGPSLPNIVETQLPSGGKLWDVELT